MWDELHALESPLTGKFGQPSASPRAWIPNREHEAIDFRRRLACGAHVPQLSKTGTS